MYYIGITVNADACQTYSRELACLNIPYENGIMYVRKGTKPEDLLVPAHELESFKGKIRRLDLNIYNQLNDDFGLHVSSRSKK